jgi:hypothetical protein
MAHISHDEHNNKIAEASKLVTIGAIYKHYKYPDRDYYVEKIAIQEASEKICIIYHDTSVPNAPSFVRDIDSWLEKVSWQGKMVPRFMAVTNA